MLKALLGSHHYRCGGGSDCEFGGSGDDNGRGVVAVVMIVELASGRFMVQGSRFRVYGVWFRVSGLGFMI